jgi:hypothetical protein
MSYGLTDNGFIKKPYEIIVEELEADYRRIFGESINLEPQSPQGQMIAIHAEGTYDVWEMAEAIYGSYNIDDVNGKLLDSRAKLRGAVRLDAESDIDFKTRIKEQLPNNVFKLKDELHDNLLRVEGVQDVTVKYLQGITKAFVLGGDDTEVAETILDYMPPGALEGNVSVAVDGRCSGVKFFRPKFVPVKLDIVVSHFDNLECECRVIDAVAIREELLSESCGVGYGQTLYADYIRNVLSQFKGLRVKSIVLNMADTVEAVDCDAEYDFVLSTDKIEVEEFERIFLCEKNISIEVE